MNDFFNEVLDRKLTKDGIEITVIDDSDFVGWAASATRLDEIYMKDVKSMVNNVLKKKGKYKIRRLNILDHGNSKTLQIGKDWIGISNIAIYRTSLSRLRGQFHSSGFIHLQHCDIGLSKDLLRELAKITGVTVYAGTGAHNPVYRFNLGDYVRAEPFGGIYRTNRPGTHVRILDPNLLSDHDERPERLHSISITPNEPPIIVR